MYPIDYAAINEYSRAPYPEIRHRLMQHLCPHIAWASDSLFCVLLFATAENYTACFHNPHLNLVFSKKAGIIALCLCTCVIPKSQKPLIEFVGKSPQGPLGTGAAAGWSGCNILELAMIGEHSGRQVDTHLVLFLYFISESQREMSEREALSNGPSKLCFFCRHPPSPPVSERYEHHRSKLWRLLVFR